MDFTQSKAFIPADKATTPRFYIILNSSNHTTISKLKTVLGKYGIAVKQPQEVFNGPYVDRAPGLVLIPEPNENKAILPEVTYSKKTSYTGVAGHSIYGVFTAYFENNTFNLDQLPNPILNTIPRSVSTTVLRIPYKLCNRQYCLLKKIAGRMMTINIVGRWRVLRKYIL